MTRWRSRMVISAWVLMIPLAIVAEEQPQGSPPVPRLVLSQTDLDVGRLAPGAKSAPAEVIIRNTGGAPLQISTLRTTCTCLIADLSATTVPPGGETTLRMQIQAVRLEASFAETVLVYSNDAVHPLVKIRVFGSIWTPITLSPAGIPVNVSNRGDLPQMQFTPVRLVSTNKGPLGPIRLVASHPSIKPKARQLDDGSYEVSITIDSTAPIGLLDEKVKVETLNPTKPVVEIPVVGTILGDLDTFGRRLDFGFVPEGLPAASVPFLVRNRGSREVHVLRAEAKLPVPAEVQVTPEGKDSKLVVRITGAAAFTRLVGEVEVHTDHPEESLLRIPVSGGVLANQPFQQATAEGSEARFLQIVKDVLKRGERVPAEQFFSQVMGGVRDERAVRVLFSALAEGDLPTRMRAVELLGGLPTPQVLERLRVVITDDPEQFVRDYALVAYAEAVGKAAVPVLLVALLDDGGMVREDAATYLGKLGDANVIPALRAAMNDPDPDANAAVHSAMEALQAR